MNVCEKKENCSYYTKIHKKLMMQKISRKGRNSKKMEVSRSQCSKRYIRLYKISQIIWLSCFMCQYR